MISNTERFLASFDITKAELDGGEIAGTVTTKRYLSDLRGCFADSVAYEATLAAGDPLLYKVVSVESGNSSGDLHYGVGLLMPGRIGMEYFMTKGHLHAWREAAEVYIGLSGEGVMLLENESNGDSQLVPLLPNQIVYVPGHTAHRTMNTGGVPLKYIGIYPAKAGHDYRNIADSNFRHVVFQEDGRPVMLERAGLDNNH